MTTARYNEGSSKNSNQVVIVTADTKQDAQAAIKLVQAWVKENGGRSKLTDLVLQLGSLLPGTDRLLRRRVKVQDETPALGGLGVRRLLRSPDV